MGYALEGPLSLLAGMPVKMTGPQTGQTMKAYLEKNPGTQADLVIAKSLNQLEVLSAKGLLEKNTIVLRIYRTPCIMVPKGNPKNIRGLNDLLKPGMRLEISDADRMEIGRMTRIMLKRQNILSQYLKHVILVREGSIIYYNKYLKQDRLDAVIDWTDIVMVNSKCWRADIDIAGMEPNYLPDKTIKSYDVCFLIRDKIQPEDFFPIIKNKAAFLQRCAMDDSPEAFYQNPGRKQVDGLQARHIRKIFLHTDHGGPSGRRMFCRCPPRLAGQLCGT